MFKTNAKKIKKSLEHFLVLSITASIFLSFLTVSIKPEPIYAQNDGGDSGEACPPIFPNCIGGVIDPSRGGVKAICPPNMQGFPTPQNLNPAGAQAGNAFIQCEDRWAQANNAHRPGEVVNGRIADYCERVFTGSYLRDCKGGFNGSSTGQACRNNPACRIGLAASRSPAVQGNGGQESQNGAAGEGQGTEELQCEANALTISWVMCAMIEFGANFTDWFFTAFLRPLLEDIPLSLDPSEGSFQAWQGFRLLANIMLVASMFAIVYAQARGDQ